MEKEPTYKNYKHAVNALLKMGYQLRTEDKAMLSWAFIKANSTKELPLSLTFVKSCLISYGKNGIKD